MGQYLEYFWSAVMVRFYRPFDFLRVTLGDQVVIRLDVARILRRHDRASSQLARMIARGLADVNAWEADGRASGVLVHGRNAELTIDAAYAHWYYDALLRKIKLLRQLECDLREYPHRGIGTCHERAVRERLVPLEAEEFLYREDARVLGVPAEQLREKHLLHDVP